MSKLPPEQTIRLGFAQLRVICDPRGHDLLAALERVCLEAVQVPERLRLIERAILGDLDEATRLGEVVELDTYSRKV